jgi:hypothetical protein
MPIVSEIVLVHNDCSDDTVAIAQAPSARFIEKNWECSHEQKNITASQATQPSILMIDAHEEWLIDRWIRHGDWYPDRGIRLFRQRQGGWTGGDGREKLEVSGRLFQLHGDLLHHAFPDFKAFKVRNDKYANLATQDLCKKNEPWSWSSAFLRPIWRFLRGYAFRLGFLDRVHGFLIAWQNGQTVFLRSAYHYEGMNHKKGG